MNRRIQQEKGFTIIEVVLVLAIAGLIFLMVFIALPALQRTQRDSQRKNDIGRVQTAITSYQSNNRNSLPGADSNSWNAFANSYLRVGGDTFEDPSFGSYTFVYKASSSDGVPSTPISTNGEVWAVGNSTCDGESLTPATGTRKVAIVVKLEGGGVYCVNN